MLDLAAALSDLLRASTRLHPDELPAAVAEAAARLGSSSTVVVLADLAQKVLRELAPLGVGTGPDIPIDEAGGAGEAYRRERPVEGADGRLWLPILDSAERYGVLGVTHDGTRPVEHWEALADLVGELVSSKSPYGDRIEQIRRIRPVSVAAEMRWSLLPPLTFASPTVTISGILQPAYRVAGDAFDYAVNGSRAHVGLFDAMGHGMEASRIANLVIGSYRNSRRAGLDLTATMHAMDELIAEQFGDARFATVQLAELDTGTGELLMLNAGHPPAVRFRRGAPPETLETEPARPVGLGTRPGAARSFQLEPGDVVVLHTDGITEARVADGEAYGEERLVEELDRLFAEGHTPGEVLRLAIHDVLDLQAGDPRDDGTLVLLAWRTGHHLDLGA